MKWLTIIQEILTGKLPYHQLLTEASVIKAILSDEKPVKPKRSESRDKDLNELWKRCITYWAKNPDERPTASEVAQDFVSLL